MYLSWRSHVESTIEYYLLRIEGKATCWREREREKEDGFVWLGLAGRTLESRFTRNRPFCVTTKEDLRGVRDWIGEINEICNIEKRMYRQKLVQKLISYP